MIIHRMICFCCLNVFVHADALCMWSSFFPKHNNVDLIRNLSQLSQSSKSLSEVTNNWYLAWLLLERRRTSCGSRQNKQQGISSDASGILMLQASQTQHGRHRTQLSLLSNPWSSASTHGKQHTWHLSPGSWDNTMWSVSDKRWRTIWPTWWISSCTTWRGCQSIEMHGCGRQCCLSNIVKIARKYTSLFWAWLNVDSNSKFPDALYTWTWAPTVNTSSTQIAICGSAQDVLRAVQDAWINKYDVFVIGGHREKDRDRQRHAETDRDRKTQTDRNRQRQTETDRQTDLGVNGPLRQLEATWDNLRHNA